MNNLQVGDRIKLIGVPPYENNKGLPTKWIIQTLIDRGNYLRINRVEHGVAWYSCRIRTKESGKLERHELTVLPDEENLYWRRVNGN